MRGLLLSLARGGARRCSRGECLSGEISLRFGENQSLRHLAEGLGIPSCEIGLALVDGTPRSLEFPPPDGSVVELLPVDEPIAIMGEPRFVADVHLGRLARELRLLGFDVLWRNDLGDLEIATRAVAEGRIALTRDRGILFRRAFAARRPDPPLAVGPGLAAPAMLVRSRDPYEQLLHAFRRFGLASYARPFSRCSSCGRPIEPAVKEEVAHLVPRVVAERYNEFFMCPCCGKPYWRGDHFRTIEPLLERLGSDLGVQLFAGGVPLLGG